MSSLNVKLSIDVDAKSITWRNRPLESKPMEQVMDRHPSTDVILIFSVADNVEESTRRTSSAG